MRTAEEIKRSCQVGYVTPKEELVATMKAILEVLLDIRAAGAADNGSEE